MIKTGSPIISIYTEMTPNPETMKFVANKLLYPWLWVIGSVFKSTGFKFVIQMCVGIHVGWLIPIGESCSSYKWVLCSGDMADHVGRSVFEREN